MIDLINDFPTDLEFRMAVMDMDLPAKRKFHRWLTSIIEDEEFLDSTEAIPTKPGREVVESKRLGKVCFRLEHVRCGNKRCKSCPHGPYWYSYTRKKGKTVSKYVGKDLQKAFKESAPVES
jgi:hypothetical protein